MTLVWWRQLYTRNAGVVDAWWSWNFGLLAVIWFFVGSGNFSQRLLLAVIVLWSLRLGLHLYIRNTSHAEEDRRYAQLRIRYGAQESWRMWRFFAFQALTNAVLALPVFLIASNQHETVAFTSIAGVGVVVVSVLGEAIADAQLKSFRRRAPGQVCRAGLWKYSRHPNYFFEWLCWVGFALVAWDAPFGSWALITPFIIGWLLIKVSGIPMLEALAIQSRGEAYRKYQQEVSAFIPWFPRKTSQF
ncbi:MAG: DUF1295 domain-containing protein [Cyclobacteriaceae bacterium]|nr:DUF1295 domain-containing protein [Cyclobacteriaceae bacterium]